MNTKNSFIRLENLSKHYVQKDSEVRAVDNLNLEIQKGEFIALLGPSGCGKSTTLMMIAGLLKPTEGNIYFHEKRVTGLAPKDRNIGMVFQSYALYPNMSVLSNICFPLRNLGVPKKERISRANEVAEILKINELLDRQVHQLSGGQQQRVAIARALVKNPDILLLDEPMSNLDARLKIDMRDEIRRLQQDIGITTIIVTHDQEEALAIADRVAVLDKGILQDYAKPLELYGKPKNLFLAHFLGTPPMNLIPCEIENRNSDLFVSHKYKMIKNVTEKSILKGKDGHGSFTLGVRPHCFQITEDDAFLSGKIVLIEQLGRETLLKVQLNTMEKTSLRILLNNSSKYTIGETLFLTTNEQIHIFNEKGDSIL